jgi:hypothetical protein
MVNNAIMIGEMVKHPVYGQGQIMAVFRNGTEWMVRFANGLRFRRPRQEFNGQQGDGLEPKIAPLPTIAPMPRTQFEARQLVETLRVGIAPAQHIQDHRPARRTRQPECRVKKDPSNRWRGARGDR